MEQAHYMVEGAGTAVVPWLYVALLPAGVLPLRVAVLPAELLIGSV